MPAHKRPLETSTSPPSPPPPLDEEEADDSPQGSDNHGHEQTENTFDSDVSPYSSDGEKDEFIGVKLAEIRKEVQCPICLGIIRKTRTVMECLHRFCRECIDKSMRLGNNECPACRTHCASRRSLRDDTNYDALIAALFPDIDKYEEEELAFHEVEKAHNDQIQASIAQTFQRQTEAVRKKRKSARLTAASFARRQENFRNLRGRRNHRVSEYQVSDEEEGANQNDSSKDSSSADEHFVEVKSKRNKRWGGARSSQPSSGATADGVCDNNESDPNRDLLVGCEEILPWGRARLRSNNRHGALNVTSGKLSGNDRISKLIDHLQSLNENDDALKISLTLVSLHEEKIPSLNRPYICCSPMLSVRHLCQYVGMQTSVEASEIEILIVKDCHPVNNSLRFRDEPGLLKLYGKELQLLDEHQTLEDIHTSFIQQNLVLAYRRKVQG